MDLRPCSTAPRRPRVDAPPSSRRRVQLARARARRRLIGARSGRCSASIGFPLVFETEPRPMPLDVADRHPAPRAPRAAVAGTPRAAVDARATPPRRGRRGAARLRGDRATRRSPNVAMPPTRSRARAPAAGRRAERVARRRRRRVAAACRAAARGQRLRQPAAQQRAGSAGRAGSGCRAALGRAPAPLEGRPRAVRAAAKRRAEQLVRRDAGCRDRPPRRRPKPGASSFRSAPSPMPSRRSATRAQGREARPEDLYPARRRPAPGNAPRAPRAVRHARRGRRRCGQGQTRRTAGTSWP